MSAHRTLRSCLATGFFLVPLIGVVGCTERKKLETQIEGKRAALVESKARLAELQKKYAATPLPGKSTTTRLSQIQELKTQINSVDEEIDRLKTQKLEVEKSNQESQKEIDEYLARHAKS